MELVIQNLSQVYDFLAGAFSKFASFVLELVSAAVSRTYQRCHTKAVSYWRLIKKWVFRLVQSFSRSNSSILPILDSTLLGPWQKILSAKKLSTVVLVLYQ